MRGSVGDIPVAENGVVKYGVKYCGCRLCKFFCAWLSTF